MALMSILLSIAAVNIIWKIRPAIMVAFLFLLKMEVVAAMMMMKNAKITSIKACPAVYPALFGLQTVIVAVIVESYIVCQISIFQHLCATRN